jgi:phi LC3 family holin
MINWKVRFQNPLWWAQMALAIITPVLVGLGMQWQDMTSWDKLGGALWQAISNPVIAVAVVASVWTAITDPTTKGTGDSPLALTYQKPKGA